MDTAATTAMSGETQSSSIPDSTTDRAPDPLAHASESADLPLVEAPDTTAAWALRWGQLLRIARQVSGLSLAQVSAASGLSKGYLSKLESGAPAAANPSRATLAALARALPSFRPLAHSLEPDGGAADLDYSRVAPWPAADAPTARQNHNQSEPAQPSALRLGWREMELMTVLMVLESAAVPIPITLAILARASGRTSAEVRVTLHRMITQSMVIEALPVRPGGSPTYRPAADAAARMDIARLGDLLVLAATMLVGAPVLASEHSAVPTAPQHDATEGEEDG